jgi:HlyD family secretion protein
MKKRLPLIMVAIVLLLLGVRKIWITQHFRYAGTLEATRVDLSARLGTVIQSIAVQEGDKVKEGGLLVSLDCQEVRIMQNLAAQNYRRGERLIKSGAMSKEAFDEMANRKQDADERLSWCNIVSPIPGTVLTRFHEPGEWVSPGAKILSLANLQDIWAYVYVPQEKVVQLKVGMELKGHLPELGDRIFTGVIRKINDEAEFTPKNVQTRKERTRLVFGVKVAFANTDEILKPGMTIELELPPG